MRKILLNKYRYLEKDKWGNWDYELCDESDTTLIGFKLSSLEECAKYLLNFGLEKNFSLVSSPKHRNVKLERGVM